MGVRWVKSWVQVLLSCCEISRFTIAVTTAANFVFNYLKVFVEFLHLKLFSVFCRSSIELFIKFFELNKP